MDSKNLVSFIISTYNGQETLDQAISSILSQSHINLEILIIDDGSTDDSFDIIQKYANEDERIKTYKNPRNIGLTKSLNFLIEQAKGEFIARQDDDDISKENIKAIKSEQSKRSGADEFAGTGRKQERQYLLPANARSGIHGYRGTEEYEDILASQNERLSLRKRVRFADMKYKRIYGSPVSSNDNTKRGQAINDSSSELTTAQAQSNNVVIMGGQGKTQHTNNAPVPLPVATRDSSSSAANSARVYY